MKRRKPAGIEGRVLVSAKQPQRIVPIVEDLDQLDAVVPKPVQFATRRSRSGAQGLRQGYSPRLYATVAGQVAGHEMLRRHVRISCS